MLSLFLESLHARLMCRVLFLIVVVEMARPLSTLGLVIVSN